MSQKAIKITVVGAGPVGALLTVILARHGYQVDLFESREDSRHNDIYQGKSINIALSDRGWLALESVGIADEVKREAIPMYHRVMHDLEGNLTRQAYGKGKQAIWSVSRAKINELLVSLAEKEDKVSLHFSCHVIDVDFDQPAITFKTKQDKIKHNSDLLFGADGAFSKVRRKMQEIPNKRISYSLDYMPQSYIELTIPPAADGSYQLEKQALHIWPRKDFMLIALPNPDGSFTCTLFMNQKGDISFDALTQRSAVEAFFQRYFSDAINLINNPIDEFISRKTTPLSLVHIDPWVVNNNVSLIGDAAHAMVPFYGQGMNCGFEDCRLLRELVSKHNDNWSEILSQYQTQRKPNCDAIIELAKRNFFEMSELSGNSSFQLCKKIEANFNERYPKLWVPLYTMVTFSPDIPYSEALRIGDIQKEIMAEIMALPNIENRWLDEDIYEMLYTLTINRNFKVKKNELS
ncbi:FAD-dependent monooxygenase [Pseudoalteromonas nigrifaciens]|uniref:FAD-dependent oxidoreductase n=1 Tax=Pseudoalteromonas nigrifaciens TaxID=28109 RepID=UPI00178899B2|nr:NAD(P)/FAD-dependent oxidoreductase [Pseudoalteromonas nigrifaciens]MBE0420539.1 FAD-dependent monooxygenase [Pseudoalteromonas nigrifaciens]